VTLKYWGAERAALGCVFFAIGLARNLWPFERWAAAYFGWRVSNSGIWLEINIGQIPRTNSKLKLLAYPVLEPFSKRFSGFAAVVLSWKTQVTPSCGEQISQGAHVFLDHRALGGDYA
jgi:hypothetical protein